MAPWISLMVQHGANAAAAAAFSDTMLAGNNNSGEPGIQEVQHPPEAA